MKAVFVDCTEDLQGVIGRRRLAVPTNLTIHHGSPSRDELAEMCQQAEVLLVEHTVLPEELLRRATNLRAIIFMGTGAGTYVPLPVCAELGIGVMTTPAYANRAVAEHALALLFAAARDITRMDRDLRAGIWAPRRGVQLHGLKVAVVGLGGIGRTFADMASSLGMRVAGWNRTAVDAPYFVADLNEALLGADVLSLHLALTEETRGLITAERLALLTRGAILVNTARAELIQTSALRGALESGQVGHAALDVFCEEPLPENDEWREVVNATLTAHAAYMTDEAYAELWAKTVSALSRVQSAA